ncbi:CDK2-associated and cullin domain-containing protein 1 [Halichoeres trimaculatus]|uniref:CDK2-associated and cullin domain-containing protein 1 n=1 Tax=Halichoeres trimaculatus TaxID=147232 RepID=UPI003D9E3D0A
MDDETLDTRDDPNRHHCVSTSSSRGLPDQRSDGVPDPQRVSRLVPEGKLGCRREQVLSCSSGLVTIIRSDQDRQTRDPVPSDTGDRGFTIDPPRFFRNSVSMEDYRKHHWPNLEKTIDRLLVHNPTDHISVSYAQIYSYVYKCVCQQHSELLYNDLMLKITSHLQQVSIFLEASPPGNIIENFNDVMNQYTASLQCIVPVFMYLNKFYVEAKLNRDLRRDLMKLFADHVAEKHVDTLISLLIRANSRPFQVQPSTMASVVKGLYSLRPEWAKLAPALFSGFIPQINPPAEESLLPDYASYDQKLQMELSMNGFPRGDQSRKRTSEDA